MKKNSVIIFLNSYAEVDGDTVCTTKAIQEFMLQIRERGMVAMLAATSAHPESDSRHDSIISDMDGFQFFPTFSRGKSSTARPSWFKKTVYYNLIRFQKILFHIPKEPAWYIFLPSPMGILACLVCRMIGKPYGVYVRSVLPESGIWGALYRFCLKKSSYILATGQSLTKHLRQYNNRTQEVAPMLWFHPQNTQGKLSYEITGKARILFVGALGVAKGSVELVKAIALVAKRHDVELVMAGTYYKEIGERLRAEIESCGLSESVRLTGYIDDKQELARLFASSDIFCFPSHAEGFARAIYEAMAFGLPIVSTDFESGDAPHFLRDGENCRFVRKNDELDLAERLIELLENEPLRAKLGERGRRDVLEYGAQFEGVTHGGQVVNAIREQNG